jgi:hypothetical protein
MDVSGYLHALVPSPRKRAHGITEQKAGWAPLAVCKFWKGEVLSTGDRIPVGARFSAPVLTDPGAHPASCTMGTVSFQGVESGRGVTLTPHPLLVPRSKKKYSYTSTLPKGLRGLWKEWNVPKLFPLPEVELRLTEHISSTSLLFQNVKTQTVNYYRVYLVSCPWTWHLSRKHYRIRSLQPLGN